MSAQLNPVKLLLNQDNDETAVATPAFSLTKVLATVATLLTAGLGVVAGTVDEADFTAQDVTLLMMGMLGFLAVLGSADILARAIATAAGERAGAVKARAEAEAARHAARGSGRARLIPVQPTLRAKVAQNGSQGNGHNVGDAAGAPAEVDLLAIASGPRDLRYLTRDSTGALEWRDQQGLTIVADRRRGR